MSKRDPRISVRVQPWPLRDFACNVSSVRRADGYVHAKAREVGPVACEGFLHGSVLTIGPVSGLCTVFRECALAYRAALTRSLLLRGVEGKRSCKSARLDIRQARASARERAPRSDRKCIFGID
jgi:hypothetical protein